MLDFPHKEVLQALRPWSFPIALTPYSVVGSDLLVNQAVPVDWAAFGLTAMASLACFIVCNLVNTYQDFADSVDNHDTADDRTLVDGKLKPTTVLLLTLSKASSKSRM